MFWRFLASHNFFHRPPLTRQGQGGFGLVELLVSIGIISLIATIVMVRQSAFNSAVLLRNQAYSIALQLRDVQLSAVAASNDTNLGSFRATLGVYFNSTGTNNAFYYSFSDANSNHFYDSNERYGSGGKLDPRFEIREVRVDGTAVSDLSVVFERPNFDAQFYTAANTPSAAGIIEIDLARRAATGTACGVQRTIEVTRTGQIAVLPCS